MKFAPYTIALCGLVLLVGCQNGKDNEYQHLQQELFAKENKIYALQADIEQYRSVLDSCRRANFALEAELEGEADNSGLPGGGSSGGSRFNPPDVDIPDVEIPDVVIPGDTGPPSVELPPGVDPSQPPPRFNPQGPSLRPPSAEQPMGPLRSQVVLADEFADDGVPIEKITLNKLLTGGFNADNNAGDEALLVVVETRDRHGNIVRGTGDVTIVLLDSEAVGASQQRFARWDFHAEEVAGKYRKSALSQGLQFELPWPGAPPMHSEMHVFVRMTTSDGRQLTADRKVKIELLEHATAANMQKRVESGLQSVLRTSQQRSSSRPVKRLGVDVDPAPQVPPTIRAVAVDEQPQQAPPVGESVKPGSLEVETPTQSAGLETAQKKAPPREAKQRPSWSPFR